MRPLSWNLMRSITLSSETNRRWSLGENSLSPELLAFRAIIPSNSAWHFYGMRHNKLATIRISFLLRLIVVDVESFLEIWSDVFSSEDWEIRYRGQPQPPGQGLLMCALQIRWRATPFQDGVGHNPPCFPNRRSAVATKRDRNI